MPSSFSSARIGIAALRRAGKHPHALDRPHCAYRHGLRARLTPDPDHAQGLRFGIGEQSGGKPARRAGAQLPEQIGLDHGLELAVERRVQQRMKLAALHAGIGFETVDVLGAVRRTHQIERTAGERRPPARDIPGRQLSPPREQLLERGDGVLDGDESTDVGFGDVDGAHPWVLVVSE
jgi:hypothetical protein